MPEIADKTKAEGGDARVRVEDALAEVAALIRKNRLVEGLVHEQAAHAADAGVRAAAAASPWLVEHAWEHGFVFPYPIHPDDLHEKETCIPRGDHEGESSVAPTRPASKSPMAIRGLRGFSRSSRFSV